jgi:hypothetical protein
MVQQEDAPGRQGWFGHMIDTQCNKTFSCHRSSTPMITSRVLIVSRLRGVHGAVMRDLLKDDVLVFLRR